MNPRPIATEDGQADLVAHFMICISRPVGQPDAVIGRVERLGTGEKRSFQSGAELLSLVTSWNGGADVSRSRRPVGPGHPPKAG